ncbi:lytic transglycosylase domain-containing protein [Streptosporangium sp. NPDC048865]|uniref:lytic transglycosylase domain-containing protein n=1 Tax=Streptosporangium sp. NPDC048865 TaxID=3155766 RepID=UPI003423705A
MPSRKLLALAGIVVVVLGFGTGNASAGSSDLKPGSVPAQYVDSVKAAAGTCDYVTAPLLAAQIEQESSWNPNAVSWAGAQGIAQFKPAAWAVYGGDFDRDGNGTPFDPQDAIRAQGIMMCDMIDMIWGSPLSGDLWTFALWAYNAGIQATIDAGGRAPTAEAAGYSRRILYELMVKYVP